VENCVCGNFLKVVAKLVGTTLEEVVIKKEQLQSKEVKAKYPKLPALLLSEDVAIYETTAIARHLARNHPLYKGDDLHMAQIDSWMELAKSEIAEKAYDGVIFPILGHKSYTNKSFNEALATFKSFLPRLNKTDAYIVGTTLTIADLFVAALLHLPFALVLDESFSKSFAKLHAWYLRVVREPAYAEIFGLPRFCKVALKPVLPPAEDGTPAPADKDKGKAKGADKKDKDKDKDKGNEKEKEETRECRVKNYNIGAVGD